MTERVCLGRYNSGDITKTNPSKNLVRSTMTSPKKPVKTRQNLVMISKIHFEFVEGIVARFFRFCLVLAEFFAVRS